MLNPKKTWSNDDIQYIIFSACGYGNIGDDAIMLGVARYLITRKKAKDLFVFAYTPKEIQQTLEKSGLTTLAKIYSGYFYGLLRNMLSSKKKVILIGGGTLITNRTFFSLYYLIPAIVFKLFRSEIHFFGVAAEEVIHRRPVRFLLSVTLRYCIKKAFVRDNFTKSILENFANGRSKDTEIKTIGDPALYLKEWEKDEEEEGESGAIAVGDDNRMLDDTVQIFLSARDVDSRSSDYYAKCFASLLDDLIEAILQKRGSRAVTISFVPFCIHKTSQLERDDLFGLKIQRQMKYSDYFQIKIIDNPIDLMQKFKIADFCICMRLHSLIFAYMTERRCLAISYSPKVYTFANDNGLPYVDIDRLEQEKKHIIGNMLKYIC
ncbi:MAG: polysaccharide pyruvyl transferase family protein [Nitrososphaeraceae archaeon]